MTPSMRVILNALKEYGAMTIPEVCKVTGLKYRSVYNTSPNALEQLKQLNEVHICEWRRAEGKGGLPKPVYDFGPGENAAYPGKKPLAEKYAISCNYNRIKRLQKATASRSLISVLLNNPFSKNA